jgi:transcriptional regulator with XRE-family HTH domain
MSTQSFVAEFYPSAMKKKESIEQMERLLKEAERQGIRKAELARRMGVDRQLITSWKLRGIPLERLEDAARSVGVTIEFLKTGLDVARFHHQLTEEERQYLAAIKILDKQDKERLLRPVLEEAERIKRYLNK